MTRYFMDYHRDEAGAHRGVDFYRASGLDCVALRDDLHSTQGGLSGIGCQYAVTPATNLVAAQRQGWSLVESPAPGAPA